jgi:hypothetical protein
LRVEEVRRLACRASRASLRSFLTCISVLW